VTVYRARGERGTADGKHPDRATARDNRAMPGSGDALPLHLAAGAARWREAFILGEAAVILGLLLLALQLRFTNPEHYSGSFDEGIRMEQLLLMEHGYRPFRDIFASQGPLLLDVLYPFYALFGGTVGAARLGVSGLSLLGLVGAWWTLRAVHPLAGLGVAALLAVSPGYLDNSRLALAELPSLAPCLWAVGCALRWQRGGRDRWLYAAAVLATFGILIKPMALPVAAPLFVLAVLRRDFRLGTMVTAALLSLALAAGVLLALDVSRVAEVLGGYRLGAQRPAGSFAAQNLTLIAKGLNGVERPGFLALAALGAGLGLVYWWRATLGFLSWPLAQLATFLLYTDLADKHVVYLVPQLGLLGGLALGGLVESGRRLVVTRSPLWAAPGLVVVLGIVLYLVTLPSIWHVNRELLRDGDVKVRRDYAGTQEQAALMAAITAPSDFVLTDNPNGAFQARRLVPPWLVDTSGTRVEAGSLTSEVVLREARQYDPKVVVIWRRRLGKLDEFNRWLEREYRLVKTYPGSDPSEPLKLYVRSDLEARAKEFLAGR
jgi:hypothetical protein